MSADNYVGLHGRSPFEGRYQAWRGKEEEHCVPEGWEDLNRGICPWCGRTVEWDERLDDWVLDGKLVVLVLREWEVDEIRQAVTQPLAEDITRMFDLNRPFEE